jgi:hypothetical protein
MQMPGYINTINKNIARTKNGLLSSDHGMAAFKNY